MRGKDDHGAAEAGAVPIPGRRVLLGAGVFGVLLCTLAFAFVDKPATDFFATRTNEALTASFRAITIFGTAVGYLVFAAAAAAGFAIAARRAGRETSADRLRLHARQSLFFLGCVLSATITNDLLKVLFGRTRPRLLIQYDLYGFEPLTMDTGFHSFPSGHAATAASVALMLYFVKPGLRHVCAAATFLICASRVVLTEHFVSDVVFGATWGFLVAAVAAKLLEPRLRPFAGIGNQMPVEERR